MCDRRAGAWLHLIIEGQVSPSVMSSGKASHASQLGGSGRSSGDSPRLGELVAPGGQAENLCVEALVQGIASLGRLPRKTRGEERRLFHQLQKARQRGHLSVSQEAQLAEIKANEVQSEKVYVEHLVQNIVALGRLPKCPRGLTREASQERSLYYTFMRAKLRGHLSFAHQAQLAELTAIEIGGKARGEAPPDPKRRRPEQEKKASDASQLAVSGLSSGECQAEKQSQAEKLHVDQLVQNIVALGRLPKRPRGLTMDAIQERRLHYMFQQAKLRGHLSVEHQAQLAELTAIGIGGKAETEAPPDPKR